MKRLNCRGFTLVEMLTVMAVIAILAGLILAINQGIQNKAARIRAEGEMAAFGAACESYKVDNGAYPRDAAATDVLDPRTEALPSNYVKACQAFYSALSGDSDRNSIPETDAKVYYTFKPEQLSIKKDKNGKPERTPEAVKYIQDPWNNCYGYSTINAKQEEEYLDKVKSNTKSKPPDRPNPVKGFNPTFDLWSTGGSTSTTKDAKTGAFRDAAKWVKNW